MVYGTARLDKSYMVNMNHVSSNNQITLPYKHAEGGAKKSKAMDGNSCE